MTNSLHPEISYIEPTPTASHWAWPDIFRGIAALLVCAEHFRAALLIDYQQISAPTLIDKFFYLLTGLGHESVIIFFTLSGFLVGGSVFNKRKVFDWHSYLAARLTRLWTVLIPALLLTLLVDTWINNLFPSALDGHLQEAWNSGPTQSNYSTSPSTLLGNIAFLQTIIVPVFGTNGPLWSLSNEFWYYIVFPLLAFSFGLIRSDWARKYRWASASFVALFFTWLPIEFLEGFIVWLMGTIAWLACRKQYGFLKCSFSVLISFLAFITALGHSKSGYLQSLAHWLSPDLLLGLTFSALLVTLYHQENQPKLRGVFGKAIKNLSEISYSLYLTHFPFVFIISLYAGTNSTQFTPSLYSFLIFISANLAAVMIAYCMWWIAERHTNKVRKLIESQSFFRKSYAPNN